MEQGSSQLSTGAPISDRLSLKQLPNPYISKETPHKGELRLTSSGYPSETKITEEETGSNPYCSAASAGDPQASRVWSGLPAVLQQRGLTVRRKTKKQKEITSSSTKRTTTQRPHLKTSPTTKTTGR